MGDNDTSSPCYYERLYKVKGRDTIYRFFAEDKDSPVFNEFMLADNRYWIENEPRLVRRQLDE